MEEEKTKIKMFDVKNKAGDLLYSVDLEIPQHLQDYFELKDVDFVTDVFENLIQEDVLQNDSETAIKINRDITLMFKEWIYTKIKAKENLSISCKGSTRSNLGDTLILMENFELKRLDSLTLGEKVFSLNLQTNKFEKKEINEIFINGVKDCYEIILEGGKKIVSSNLHKFYSISNLSPKNNPKTFSKPQWIEVRNLSIGDYLAVPNNLDFEISCNIALNELKLLGFYLADGYLKNNHSKNSKGVVFDLSKQHKIDFLNDCVDNTTLNYTYSRCTYVHKENPNWANGNKFQFCKKYQNKGLNNSNRYRDDFSQLIYNLKLNNCLCDKKFIPNIIKAGTKQEIIYLLSGLFSGDGSIDITKGLIYHTTSEYLSEDIKICLTKLNINYTERIRKKQKSHHRISYEIRICAYKDLEFILNNFKLDTSKIELIKKCLNLKNKNELKNIYIDFEGDIQFKKIKSINYVGKKKVYDIEVKDNNNYIANLILSHNSGKSISLLAVAELVCSFYSKPFDTEYIICGNQKEYRTKLATADFGDFFQIDENAFTNVGMGSTTEMHQLKDIQNIIAKMNIHTGYVTPRSFLQTNSIVGISTWGKDFKNWLNRFLVYDLRSSSYSLLGHIIIDVGKMFRKYGCLMYKDFGGCTNPNRLLFTKFHTDKNLIEFDKTKDLLNPEPKFLNMDLLKYSSCIPQEFRDNPKLAQDTFNEQQIKQLPCPFYNVCKHPMCRYEHKKDTWIAKEMKGGLDERTAERFKTSLKLLQKLGSYEITNNIIILSARDSKQLKIKINLYIGQVTSTKYTGTELEDILVTLKSMTNLNFLKEVVTNLEMDFNTEMDKFKVVEFDSKSKETNVLKDLTYTKFLEMQGIEEIESEDDFEKPKSKKSKNDDDEDEE